MKEFVINERKEKPQLLPVLLKSAWDDYLEVIRTIRNETGISLVETKAYVDGFPREDWITEDLLLQLLSDGAIIEAL